MPTTRGRDFVGGFEQFCQRQEIRLKRAAIGLDEETDTDDRDTIERRYRQLRLGPKLDRVDRIENRIHVERRS